MSGRYRTIGMMGGRLLLIAFMALALPTSASAQTQWFYKSEAGPEREAIPLGQVVEIHASTIKKPLTIALKVPKQTVVKIPCYASGTEAFWNSETNGLDETRSIAFSCEPAPCGQATVTPFLPWTSTLLEGPMPLIDLWEGVVLELSCGGVDYGVFTGSLEAKVGDVDPAGEKETELRDELDNVTLFKGSLTRAHLIGPNGVAVWLGGYYRLGEKSTGVGDEDGFN